MKHPLILLALSAVATAAGGFDNKDIRFTTSKDGALYAIALGWPEGGRLTIESLSQAKYSTAIKGVRLLGHSGKLAWTRTLKGLEIELPARAPCEHAFAFKIVTR